ncbi:MAG: NADH-quinone oxidoreductase subunit J [Saprospiraceae bacterium]|nr:NADH-quinone oxidoreductase subunit J [Saprospiraceae bacterium]MDZ4704372.1 NADH-quinone oxidoreductase subunit J [Saprospiraceae bacterium]
MTATLFYILALVSVVGAIAVIAARNPVYSVLCLVVTFFAIAGQYVLLNAQFLAIVHVIVYAGAIMVLFLFVLMMLNLNRESEPLQPTLIKVIAVASGGMLLLTLVAALRGVERIPLAGAQDTQLGLVKNLGRLLFTEYVAPFEISSILFLAAMVGAVTIGMRSKSDKREIINHL